MTRACYRLCLTLGICLALAGCGNKDEGSPAPSLADVRGVLQSVDVYIGLIQISTPTELSICIDVAGEDTIRIAQGTYEDDVTVAIKLDRETNRAKIAVNSEGGTLASPLEDLPLSKIRATSWAERPRMNNEGERVFFVGEDDQFETVLRIYAQDGIDPL